MRYSRSPIRAHRSSVEFSQISRNLYVKITFVFADGNLSLEVSDQIGETLEVTANFTNLFIGRNPSDAVHVKSRLFICRTTRITHRTRHKKKKS